MNLQALFRHFKEMKHYFIVVVLVLVLVFIWDGRTRNNLRIFWKSS